MGGSTRTAGPAAPGRPPCLRTRAPRSPPAGGYLPGGRVFTGIVEELGEVVALDERDGSARLAIRGPGVTSDAARGDSIAVNGVCLTVTSLPGDGVFTADVMGETLRRTGLGGLAPGDQVN